MVTVLRHERLIPLACSTLKHAGRARQGASLRARRRPTCFPDGAHGVTRPAWPIDEASACFFCAAFANGTRCGSNRGWLMFGFLTSKFQRKVSQAWPRAKLQAQDPNTI